MESDSSGPSGLIESCNHYSLLGRAKLGVVYDVLKNLDSVPEGDMVELGVYKGGSALLIASLFPDKQFHLFDTFEGMPENSDPCEIHKEGDFSDTSLESVKNTLRDFKNIKYYKGYFPGTAEHFKEKIAIAFCDGDYYQSTKDFIEVFAPMMAPGGIMLFDDYEWENCPGVKKAIEESDLLVNLKQEKLGYIYCIRF